MKIIGHRGAKGLAPENTLRALKKALEHQVDEIEFDVRVSQDGIPLLHHDATIVLGGESFVIREQSYKQLRAVDPDLTSLAEALQFIHGQTVLLIEVKSHEPTLPIAKVLRAAISKGYPADKLLLGSFSQKTLRALHHELPQIEKVIIERWSGVKAVWRARQVGATRLNMKALWLWRGFLRLMQARGYQIAPYTVNDPAQIRHWEPYLYGVITDRPDLFEK